MGNDLLYGPDRSFSEQRVPVRPGVPDLRSFHPACTASVPLWKGIPECTGTCVEGVSDLCCRQCGGGILHALVPGETVSRKVVGLFQYPTEHQWQDLPSGDAVLWRRGRGDRAVYPACLRERGEPDSEACMGERITGSDGTVCS